MFATVLVGAAADQGSFSWVQVLTLAVVFAVVWPAQARLRRSLSERRRARWADAESEDTSQDERPDTLR